MKKIIFTILLAIVAIGANAQVTFNVRAGGASATNVNGNDGFGVAFQFQTNIPFARGSKWTFSPSVIAVSNFEDVLHVYAPLTVGFKVPMSTKSQFFPKLGVSCGVEAPGNFVFGPTASFDFEISHFVIGINAYYSLIESGHNSDKIYYDGNYVCPNSVALTLGYKF